MSSPVTPKSVTPNMPNTYTSESPDAQPVPDSNTNNDMTSIMIPEYKPTMRSLQIIKYGDPNTALQFNNNFNNYSNPNTLKVKLKKQQILVKVYAASLNAADMHIMRGSPCIMRLGFGCFRPKPPICKGLGMDFAGIVVAVSGSESDDKNVNYQPGDRVFGDLSDSGCACLSEFVLINDSKYITHIPNIITHNLPNNNISQQYQIEPNILEQNYISFQFTLSAALPVAGSTALGALRDSAKVTSADKVLIVGASGGVGHFAVQIAKKWFKCHHVTGVCSTRNVDMVKNHCGADEVIDYTKEDYKQTKRNEYDVIIDCANDKTATDNLKLSGRALKENGRYVMIGGKNLFKTLCCGSCIKCCQIPGGRNKKVIVHMYEASGSGLCKELIEVGVLQYGIRPYIDSVKDFWKDEERHESN